MTSVIARAARRARESMRIALYQERRCVEEILRPPSSARDRVTGGCRRREREPPLAARHSSVKHAVKRDFLTALVLTSCGADDRRKPSARRAARPGGVFGAR